MRFQVPQFIEIEDKIFGPLTFKQFIYLTGSVGLSVILFTFLPKFLALILSVPVVVFGLALAFYKMNSRPFIRVAEDLFHYSLSSKLYLWKKEDRKPTVNTDQRKLDERPLQQVSVPKLSASKLKDLSWELDIKENPNPITKDTL